MTNPDTPSNSAARRLVAYSFLVVFANDGTISEDELAMLEKLALEDHIIDDEERRVLANIFGRVSKETVSETVWEEIENFKSEQGIG